MYELSIRTHFSAAHHLEGYAGSCASHHGHNWDVEVFVQGDRLNDTGILVDFRRLRERVKRVMAAIDHSDLNTLDAFRDRNPTSENVARFLYGRLTEELEEEACRLSRVAVRETPGTQASYWE